MLTENIRELIRRGYSVRFAGSFYADEIDIVVCNRSHQTVRRVPKDILDGVNLNVDTLMVTILREMAHKLEMSK